MFYIAYKFDGERDSSKAIDWPCSCEVRVDGQMLNRILDNADISSRKLVN